jgi:hypothetical protein
MQENKILVVCELSLKKKFKKRQQSIKETVPLKKYKKIYSCLVNSSFLSVAGVDDSEPIENARRRLNIKQN